MNAKLVHQVPIVRKERMSQMTVQLATIVPNILRHQLSALTVLTLPMSSLVLNLSNSAQHAQLAIIASMESMIDLRFAMQATIVGLVLLNLMRKITCAQVASSVCRVPNCLQLAKRERPRLQDLVHQTTVLTVKQDFIASLVLVLFFSSLVLQATIVQLVKISLRSALRELTISERKDGTKKNTVCNAQLEQIAIEQVSLTTRITIAHQDTTVKKASTRRESALLVHSDLPLEL